MAPRGRPPLTRGVYSFEDQTLLTPREVLLDTDFVFEALASAQPLHRACSEFLSTLAREGVTVYFSSLLEVELHDTAFQAALKERSRRDLQRRRHDGRERRRIVRLMDQVMTSWEEILSALPWARIEVGEVIRIYPRLMKSFGLRSNDAVHAASALFAQVDWIVTKDSDFAAIPESYFNLLLNTAAVSRCRRYRAEALDR